MRDDFSADTKDILSRRAGARCSNPGCRKLTSGPAQELSKAINIGVAAHIKAASPGGPRFDRSLSKIGRSSIDNGVWLCQSCAKLVDSDPNRFSVSLLNRWKKQAERIARLQLDGSRAQFETPPSVFELISIVELRAKKIHQAMQRRKAQALRIFEEGKWRTISKDFPIPDTRDLLSNEDPSNRILAMFARDNGGSIATNHPWFGISSVYGLAMELNALTRCFKELHTFHVTALRSGNYVAAHEAVSEIHTLLDDYRTLSTPPGIYWPNPIHYCIPLNALAADSLIQNRELNARAAGSLIQNRELNAEAADSLIQNRELNALAADSLIQNRELNAEATDSLIQNRKLNAEVAGSLMQNYYNASAADRMIQIRELYPGKIPRSMKSRIPITLSQHYLLLTEGDDEEDWNRALGFAKEAFKNRALGFAKEGFKRGLYVH